MFIRSLRFVVVNTSVSSLIMSTPMKIRIKNISRFASPVISNTTRIQPAITSAIFSESNIKILLHHCKIKCCFLPIVNSVFNIQLFIGCLGDSSKYCTTRWTWVLFTECFIIGTIQRFFQD